MGRTDFVDQFRKIIKQRKSIGLRQSACLVINPITVDNFAALFNCTPVDRASDSILPDRKLFILAGWNRSSFVCCLVHQGSTDDLLLLRISSCVGWQTRDLHLSHNTLYRWSFSCFFIVSNHDLFVYHDPSVTN